jgi:hypothetical protein
VSAGTVGPGPDDTETFLAADGSTASTTETGVLAWDQGGVGFYLAGIDWLHPCRAGAVRLLQRDDGLTVGPPRLAGTANTATSAQGSIRVGTANTYR